MAGDSVQYYCIKEPCCRLCQFQLEDGEFVVAAIEDDHVSASFSFRRHDTFEDDEEAITFHMCCESACIKGECRVHCFHDACYRFKLFLITSKYLAATEYSFSLPVRDGLKRRGRIQRTFAKKLKLGFLNQLPQEICHMVAGYLVRECAIVTSQELALDVSASNSLVDLSHDVYAQYVRIEGVLYLRSLHNESFSEGKGENVRVFKACPSRPVRNIYIRYDYLGVRDICFVLPQGDFDGCGVWWTELSQEGGILQVTTQTDGLKVRRLLDPTDSTSKCDSTATPPGWPTPGLACRVIDLETCKIARGEINGLRMSFFDCNRPGTEGYSAAICGFHLSKLYAHHSGTCTRFYEELDTVCSDMLWVYMPIDQDEYLKEVWVIRHPGAGFLALMLWTSLGRAVIFGTYIVNPELQFHRIYATTNHPSRIYFNEWDPNRDDMWIKFLGIDTNNETGIAAPQGEKHRRSQYPPSLIPTLAPPYTQYNELWYYTNCRMENVTEITCCVNKTAMHKPIIGMLLGYKNGRRSCVGQYRVDWAIASFKVDPGGKLKIGMGKTVKRFPYVAEVSAQCRTGSDSLRWIEIPWQGRLEWWFSPRQCELRHFD